MKLAESCMSNTQTSELSQTVLRYRPSGQDLNSYNLCKVRKAWLIIKGLKFSCILTLFVVVLNQNIWEFDALAHYTLSCNFIRIFTTGPDSTPSTTHMLTSADYTTNGKWPAKNINLKYGLSTFLKSPKRKDCFAPNTCSLSSQKKDEERTWDKAEWQCCSDQSLMK